MSYEQQQNQEIVESVSFSNLLNQRAALVERLHAAKAAYDEAQVLCHAMGIVAVLNSGPRDYRDDLHLGLSTYMPNVSAEIDSQLWDKLMKESGLRSFMNDKTRREWDEQLRGGKAIPAFTAENVAATFRALYASRGDMFECGVIDAFKSLSWDYKTNCPCKFGKRVIMTYFARPLFGVCFESTNKLDDLERVFHILDGKPEPDHREGWYTRIGNKVMEASSTYLHVKRYKNGNAHLTFLRPDLVEQLNDIIAKHYPDALAARVA